MLKMLAITEIISIYLVYLFFQQQNCLQFNSMLTIIGPNDSTVYIDSNDYFVKWPPIIVLVFALSAHHWVTTVEDRM